MPFTNRPYAKQLSDIVVNELDPKVGYARETINVTPPAGGAPLAAGTVVYRVKSADPLAAYAVLSADTQVAATNEFAVVFGDHYGFKESFVPSAVDSSNPIAGNAVAFVRGPVQLKDYYLRQIAQDSGGANLSDSEFNQLCELLSKQGIIVEKTLTEQ